MEKTVCYELISKCKVVPAVRADSGEQALQIVDALEKGGVSCIEITMAVPGAAEVIKQVSQNFPNIAVGAGTVLDGYTAQKAVESGASFVVGPCFQKGIITVCQRYGVLCQIGALTSSEMLTAYEAGADVVKIFPVGQLGPGYVKGLKAILPHIPVVAVGGINLENALSYIKAGAAAVGVASALVDKKAVKESQFHVITENAIKFIQALTL